MCFYRGPFIDNLPKFAELTERAISDAKSLLGINLEPFKDRMLHAESYGRLELTYFGPGQFKKIGKYGKYNTKLVLFNKVIKLYSTTNYDSRSSLEN